MASNRDSRAAAAATSLNTFHWENGDGAQYFSVNPIATDNGDITLITLQQLDICQSDAGIHDNSSISAPTKFD